MLASMIAALVDTCRRHAKSVVTLAILIGMIAGYFVSTNVRVNTNVSELLPASLPWRQQEIAMDKAFPNHADTLLIVIDSDSAAKSETAAEALTKKLAQMPQLFQFVTRPDANPYFKQNGLLLLDKPELASTLEELAHAQPLLATIAASPNLKGFFDAISLLAQGGPDAAPILAPILKGIGDSIDGAAAGKTQPLNLDMMMSGAGHQTPTRKLILTKPVLDYTVLQPGEKASTVIRDVAKDLGFTKANGISIRLTGSVPLSDEEFGTIQKDAGLTLGVSGIGVLILLALALRSIRLVLPILFTLLIGLICTAAFAFAAIGELNLISVAFAVMFIGIAVDFGIQFGVRFRDQLHQEPDLSKAMARTARLIAAPLAMAAAATALGFFAFLPTDYTGVAELGTIAGVGMLIAFTLNITLLPALLALTKPLPERESLGFRWAAPLDSFLQRNSSSIRFTALGLAIVGIALTTQLRMDVDPLNLKDQKSESVSTLFELMKDPDFAASTINLIRPTLEEADRLADQISKLSSVDHVLTIKSFVPDDQVEKRAMIADTAVLYTPVLGARIDTQKIEVENAGRLRDILQNMINTLHPLAVQNPDAAALLPKLTDAMARADDAEFRQHLSDALAQPLAQRIQSAITALDPSPEISVDTIPPELRDDWITGDHRYRVEVYPRGNARDPEILKNFVLQVQGIASDASGSPISITESGKTITHAFVQAGLNAIVAIALLSLIVLRRFVDVLKLLTPLLLAAVMTLGTMVVIGLPLNFANIIALPLLLSLGVSYAVYFVWYSRDGQTNPLQSSMARAVLFSASTVLAAFGALALSSHPGTRSMGELLTIALLYSGACTFFLLPVLLDFTNKGKSN